MVPRRAEFAGKQVLLPLVDSSSVAIDRASLTTTSARGVSILSGRRIALVALALVLLVIICTLLREVQRRDYTTGEVHCTSPVVSYTPRSEHVCIMVAAPCRCRPSWQARLRWRCEPTKSAALAAHQASRFALRVVLASTRSACHTKPPGTH